MKLRRLFNLISIIFLFLIIMTTLSGCRNNQDDTVNIKVNQMECFSGKTKQEIYDIRKKYVAKSIFKSKDYEPNEEVFGQIEDGLPWRSIFTELCTFTPIAETKGWSEESRFINNPELLLGIRNGCGTLISKAEENNKPTYYCFSTMGYFMPDKITYSKNKKLITVYYKDFHNIPSKYISYYFETINAQDFGYKYGKMIPNNEISFKNPKDNISTRIYKFQDFIHKGDSCGVEGGCNNCSPYIEGFEFSPLLTLYNRQSKEMNIKLWKERPNDDNTEADMNYRVVFLNTPIKNNSLYNTFNDVKVTFSIIKDTINRIRFDIKE